MKKSKKLKRLRAMLNSYNYGRCYFKYSLNYRYFYILDCTEKVFLGAEEDDFLLDGFHIRRISDMKKIEVKDDLCVKINRENKLLESIEKPDIDLSSWKKLFKSLKKLNCFIIIENEYLDMFYIGSIEKAKKNSVVFHPFDADGVWFDSVEVPYKKITHVVFGDRYSKGFEEYFRSRSDFK